MRDRVKQKNKSALKVYSANGWRFPCRSFMLALLASAISVIKIETLQANQGRPSFHHPAGLPSTLLRGSLGMAGALQSGNTVGSLANLSPLFLSQISTPNRLLLPVMRTTAEKVMTAASRRGPRIAPAFQARQSSRVGLTTTSYPVTTSGDAGAGTFRSALTLADTTGYPTADVTFATATGLSDMLGSSISISKPNLLDLAGLAPATPFTSLRTTPLNFPLSTANGFTVNGLNGTTAPAFGITGAGGLSLTTTTAPQAVLSFVGTPNSYTGGTAVGSTAGTAIFVLDSGGVQNAAQKTTLPGPLIVSEGGMAYITAGGTTGPTAGATTQVTGKVTVSGSGSASATTGQLYLQGSVASPVGAANKAYVIGDLDVNGGYAYVGPYGSVQGSPLGATPYVNFVNVTQNGLILVQNGGQLGGLDLNFPDVIFSAALTTLTDTGSKIQVDSSSSSSIGSYTSATGRFVLNPGTSLLMTNSASVAATTLILGVAFVNGGSILATSNATNNTASSQFDGLIVMKEGLASFQTSTGRMAFNGSLYMSGGTFELINDSATSNAFAQGVFAITGGQVSVKSSNGGLTSLSAMAAIGGTGSISIDNTGTSSVGMSGPYALTVLGAVPSLQTIENILVEGITDISGLYSTFSEVGGGTLIVDNHGTGSAVSSLEGPCIIFPGGHASFTNSSSAVGTQTYLKGPTSVLGGTLAANNASLYDTVSVTNNGIFVSGTKGVLVGGTIPGGVSTPGYLDITDATHEAYIANGMSPVNVVSGAVNLNDATLNIVSSFAPSTYAGQQLLVVTSAGNASSYISGKYSALTSTNFLKYNVMYTPASVIGDPDAVQEVRVVVNSLQAFRDYVVSTTNPTNFEFAAANTGLSAAAAAIPSVPSSKVPSSLKNAFAMASYYDRLVTQAVANPTSDLFTVMDALNNLILAGNTSGYQSALNQIQNSLTSIMGASAFNNGTALTMMTSDQMLTFITDVEGDLRADGIFSFTSGTTSVAPSRLATFGKLVTQQMTDAQGISGLKNASAGGRSKPKGILGTMASFTNGPTEVNRHPSTAERIHVGKANVWIQPYGQVTSQKGNSNGNPNVRTQTGGFALGGDYELTPNTLIGILAGTSATPFSWNQDRGKGHMNSGFGGLYAAWKEGCGFYVEGQAIFGGNRFKANRKIKFETINRIATGKHNAFQFTGNVEFGYVLPVYDWFMCQPFILADYMVMREGGYTETGAQSLNMSVKARTSQFFQGEIGAMVYKTFAVGETLLRPTAELGWMQRRPIGATDKVKGGLDSQPSTLVVTGVDKIYNQIAPGLGLIAQFANGMYVSGNLYGECGGGLNIGEAVLRIGYEF